MAKAKPLKTPKQLGLTPEQYKNLAKLIIFVKDRVEPPKFNMYAYYHSTRMRTEHGRAGSVVGNPKYGCGTTACFCGHGPLAGIRPKHNEDWCSYGVRAFGVDMSERDGTTLRNMWLFLFSDDHKNSKIAACKRAAWLLQHGLPSLDVYYGSWEVPRSFKPDWAAIEELAKS